MNISLIFCFIGTTLLILSVILCIVSGIDHPWLWIGIQIIGELFAWLGVIPIWLEFLGK